MMQTFRNNMKVIFFVLIFFFVGWMAFTLTGLDDFIVQQNRKEYRGAKFAGVVGDEKISRQQYQDRVRQAVEIASSQRPAGGLSSWEVDQISDQVWSQMVNDIVVGRALKRHDIRVTDSEVVEYIKTNPLSELMREPQLQTDGRFDYDKYLQLLADPRAAGLVTQLESDAREKIPSFKLFLEVASLYKLTDNELKDNYRAAQEKVKVEYVHFPTDSLVSDTDVQVSDAEVQDFYNAHLKDFERPNIASIAYVTLPVIPSSLDSAVTRDTLQIVLDQLKKGVSWDSLAAQYSQGPLASQGGDLGWFAKGDLQDEKMVDLAMSLKIGEVSAPTATTDGMLILRLDSTKVLNGIHRVRARRIIRGVVPGPEQLNVVRARSRNIRNIMRQEGSTFTAVAADSGLAVLNTGYFTIGNQIQGLQAGRDLMDYIYSATTGSISYPITVFVQGRESVALIDVLDRKEAGTVPLAEAKPGIVSRLKLDRKKPLAEKVVRQMLADYDNYENLQAFAEAKGLILQTSDEFTRLSGLPGVGRNNPFVGTAFGLAVGVKSDLVDSGGDFYLLQVLSRTEADMSDFDQAKANLAQQLVSQRMQNMFALFSNELYEKEKIEDLRKFESTDSTAANKLSSLGSKR